MCEYLQSFGNGTNGTTDEARSYSRSFGNFYGIRLVNILGKKSIGVWLCFLFISLIINLVFLNIDDDASSTNGAKFEIGSGTKLPNDIEGKNGIIDDHGLGSAGQNVSRSVISQSNNMDDTEDCRPKILLMGLRR